MGGRGGVTPVHTTLIPEMNISLWGTAANIERAEKNINPLLNAIGTGVIGKVASVGGVYLPAGGEREKEKENKQPSVSSSVSAFDTFADANMFTMKSLDAYVLYSLAPPLGVDDASDTGCTCGRRWQPNITCNNSIYVNPISVYPHQLTGPASQLRPAYFFPSLVLTEVHVFGGIGVHTQRFTQWKAFLSADSAWSAYATCFPEIRCSWFEHLYKCNG